MSDPRRGGRGRGNFRGRIRGNGMEYSSRGRNDANRFGSRRENEDARGGDRDSFGGGGRWDDRQNDSNEVASERYKGKLKGSFNFD